MNGGLLLAAPGSSCSKFERQQVGAKRSLCQDVHRSQCAPGQTAASEKRTYSYSREWRLEAVRSMKSVGAVIAK